AAPQKDVLGPFGAGMNRNCADAPRYRQTAPQPYLLTCCGATTHSGKISLDGQSPGWVSGQIYRPLRASQPDGGFGSETVAMNVRRSPGNGPGRQPDFGEKANFPRLAAIRPSVG